MYNYHVSSLYTTPKQIRQFIWLSQLNYSDRIPNCYLDVYILSCGFNNLIIGLVYAINVITYLPINDRTFLNVTGLVLRYFRINIFFISSWLRGNSYVDPDFFKIFSFTLTKWKLCIHSRNICNIYCWVKKFIFLKYVFETCSGSVWFGRFFTRNESFCVYKYRI